MAKLAWQLILLKLLTKGVKGKENIWQSIPELRKTPTEGSDSSQIYLMLRYTPTLLHCYN